MLCSNRGDAAGVHRWRLLLVKLALCGTHGVTLALRRSSWSHIGKEAVHSQQLWPAASPARQATMWTPGAFALAHGQSKDSDIYFLMYGSVTI